MSLGPRLLCVLAAAALAAPAAALADPPTTGGSEAPPRGSTGGTTVSAEGHVGITARAGTMLRRVARFRGNAPGEAIGRTVTIERFEEREETWIPVATATVEPDGTYLARWRTDRSGRHRVRAVLPSDGQATAAAASPEVEITVHRRSMATWYGPGFYGRRTACGQRMTRSLVGVAHKRLPCGTQVALLYRGRTITVPVVDRGPFRRGVRWDLTSATAEALGFEHTDRLGAVRIR